VQGERRVGDRDVLEKPLPRFEGRHHRPDRAGVLVLVASSECREGGRDVVGEVGTTREGGGNVARVVRASEREQGERRRIQSDRGRGGCRLEPERPVRELVDGRIVAGEERRLERSDRPPPRVGCNAGVEARAPVERCAPEPVTPAIVAGHQQREGGGVGQVSSTDKNTLVRLTVLDRVARLLLRCDGNPFHRTTLYWREMETTFHGLTFVAEPGRVFRPRAATERLVDTALARLGDRPARIADVGTGSGAIAITLALRAPAVEVWASDTCRRALTLASMNAEVLGARVHLVQGDLLDGLPHDLDLIVANLPYLAPGTPGYDEEPASAVFSTGDGLDHYRRLLAGAADHLSPGGGVLIQLDGDVLEAERSELPWLRARLDSLVATAA
jgi:methylase of polypeptide subunit release factors